MKKKNSARFFALIPLALMLAACTCLSANGRVWLDQNANGSRDVGESGVAGVEVQVVHPNGDGSWDKLSDLFLACTPSPCDDVTDSGGLYSAGIPGRVGLRFVLPEGYEFTLPNQLYAPNPDLSDLYDSDVDPQGGIIVLSDIDMLSGDCRGPFCLGLEFDFGPFDVGLIALPTPTPEIVVPLPPSIDAFDTPEVSVSVATNCRSGPSASYSYVATVEIGQKVEVVAVFPESEYVVVKLADGKQCWLWLRYADFTDFSAYPLPEATQPPTPTATNTTRPPTKTPGPADTATPTPTFTPKPPIG